MAELGSLGANEVEVGGVAKGCATAARKVVGFEGVAFLVSQQLHFILRFGRGGILGYADICFHL